MKYSYRVRLAIVKRVKQGEAISHLSEAYSVSRNKIREWVQMWDKYGCSGLKYQPHSRPTRALKEKIVRLILERGVPLTQVRVEYRICRTTLYCWVNTVRKYGYDGLEPSKRMGRPKKKEPQTELERLQAENLRLRAENALLKKAKALVETKSAQEPRNGHESSTN